MQIRIKNFIFFCLLAGLGSILEVKAAVDNSRLQDLLEKAKARREEKAVPSTSVKEESGYLPASNTKTKEVIHEETYTQRNIELNKSVPKTPAQTNVNELFNQTRTNIENHKQEPVKPIVKPVVKPYQAPVAKVAPKTITKTTAKPPVVVPAKPVVPAPAVVPTKTVAPAAKPATPAKTVAKPSPATVKKDPPAIKVESKNVVTQTPSKTQAVTNSKIEVEDIAEEDVLEEDEFMQDPNDEFAHEDEEEAELDKDEGLKKTINIEEKKINIPPRKPLDKATREKEYLDLIKKSLKSLEEDSWNEVKFNMNETLEYFNKEKSFYLPDEIDKFYRIALAFLRFAEGGLELDQGDFADFEDAEAHYLDAQDIIDGVEIKLNANNPTDKELLNVIQTVKKYINEDIEYIEEMIDLS